MVNFGLSTPLRRFQRYHLPTCFRPSAKDSLRPPSSWPYSTTPGSLPLSPEVSAPGPRVYPAGFFGPAGNALLPRKKPEARVVRTSAALPLRKGARLCETIGRDGGIRTRDPLHPMQVRYQAALRPEE